MFPLVNPLDMYSKRIDILKRINLHPWARTTALDRSTYDVQPNGQIVRKFPKKPSKYALRKNTKRARKMSTYSVRAE